MKANFTLNSLNASQNRSSRRDKKGAFCLENSAITELKSGLLLVYAFLRSCIGNGKNSDSYHKNRGVALPCATIAYYCGISEKSVSNYVAELVSIGKIEVYQQIKQHSVKKYGANIYVLPELPDEDYTLVPRSIFKLCEGKFIDCDKKYHKSTFSPQQFHLLIFFIKSHHKKYGKSWNSANDILLKTNGKITTSRSQIFKLIKRLCNANIVKRKSRIMLQNNKKRGVFADNIYRIDKKFIVNLKAEFFKKLALIKKISEIKYRPDDNFKAVSLHQVLGKALHIGNYNIKSNFCQVVLC